MRINYLQLKNRHEFIKLLNSCGKIINGYLFMNISTFDNSVFSSEPSLVHLHFDSSFSMQINNNLVIFAHNGICKTSIANFLSNKYPDQFFLISYKNGLAKYSSVKENKKIMIKADSTNYQKAISDFDLAFNQLDIKGKITSILGISQTAASKCGISYFEVMAKTNTINLLTISETVFNDINNRIGPVRDVVGKNLKLLFQSTANLSREMDNMKDLAVRTSAKTYLNNLEIDEDSTICPICGQTISGGVHLRQLLNDLLSNTASMVEPLFSNYISTHTMAEIANLISNVINVFSTHSENEICEYLLLGDSYTHFALLNDLIVEVNNKKGLVNNEHNNLATLGLELDNSIDTIKDVFVNKMGFSNVKYIPNEFTIEIKTSSNKSLDKYSTGELNLMIFLLELCLSKGNNKPTILLDDPVSSYDVPNQYRIIFEIIDYLYHHSSKNVLLFTHNLEVLNIVRAYSFSLPFDYKYVEKYNDRLFLMDIPMNNYTCSVDLNQIINSDNSGFLKAVQYRDNPVYNSLSASSNLGSAFHYDDRFTSVAFDVYTLTNQYLIDFIEQNQFALVSIGRFADNQKNKILTIIALRTFIEYKFANVNSTFSSTLRGMLGQKISCIEANQNMMQDLLNRYPNFKMSVIKRTKAMLNNNEHYNSQVLPFYYAMNVSLQDIIEEAKTIKDMFN